MTDKRLDQLLAWNPRIARHRSDVASRIGSTPPGEIEGVCIEAVEENLALLGVLFFEVRPSPSARVESLAQNDCLAGAILFLEVLQRLWQTSEQPTSDRIGCLNTILDLLSVIGTSKDQLCSTVHGELIAAYFLSLTLKNERVGKALLDGVKYDVFLNDSLYRPLLSKTSLHEILQETRRQYLQGR